MATATYKKAGRAGFTLMELMIAMTVLGLLMAVVAPSLNNVLKKGKVRTAKATLRGFKDGISSYQMDVGQLPQSLKELIQKPREERAAKKWEGPYIDKEELPEDPWGESFVYKITPGAKHAYELHSRGPNGAEASKEEWISVWDE